MFGFSFLKPGPFIRPVIRHVFQDALLDIADILRDDFNSTTETWDNRPVFRVKRDFGSNRRLAVFVYTDDQQYIWVNNGTEPHIIEAQNEPTLAFHTGYIPKTLPTGDIQARAGGETGPMTFPVAVEHPGAEARNFDLRIIRNRERQARQIIRFAADKAAIRSGHRISSVRFSMRNN